MWNIGGLVLAEERARTYGTFSCFHTKHTLSFNSPLNCAESSDYACGSKNERGDEKHEEDAWDEKAKNENSKKGGRGFSDSVLCPLLCCVIVKLNDPSKLNVSFDTDILRVGHAVARASPFTGIDE